MGDWGSWLAQFGCLHSWVQLGGVWPLMMLLGMMWQIRANISMETCAQNGRCITTPSSHVGCWVHNFSVRPILVSTRSSRLSSCCCKKVGSTSEGLDKANSPTRAQGKPLVASTSVLELLRKQGILNQLEVLFGIFRIFLGN